jgi:hypothetical protein
MFDERDAICGRSPAWANAPAAIPGGDPGACEIPGPVETEN